MSSMQPQTSSAGEKAVRDYLSYLDDPRNLADTDELKKLQERLDATTDRMERVEIRTQMERCYAPDETQLREQFVIHAKQWADDNGISPEALRLEGVPKEVLAEAGFEVDTKPTKKSKQRKANTASKPKRSRTGVDQLKQWMQARTEPFTIATAMSETGASRVTVNKAIEQAGATEIGPDPDHSGPGAPPKLFAITDESHEDDQEDDPPAVDDTATDAAERDDEVRDDDGDPFEDVFTEEDDG